MHKATYSVHLALHTMISTSLSQRWRKNNVDIANIVSIALLQGDNAPDAAARARGVAMGAWDEVAVEVHDGLACRLAAIHPHVVAVRLVALLDPGFRQVQNRRQRPLLLRSALIGYLVFHC